MGELDSTCKDLCITCSWFVNFVCFGVCDYPLWKMCVADDPGSQIESLIYAASFTVLSDVFFLIINPKQYQIINIGSRTLAGTTTFPISIVRSTQLYI